MRRLRTTVRAVSNGGARNSRRAKATVRDPWAKRLQLGEHEAADLIQDLFAVLVEQLPYFIYDRRKSFRAYLKMILLNRWRDRMRRRAAEKIDLGAALNEIATK